MDSLTSAQTIGSMLAPPEPWLYDELSPVFPGLLALLVQEAPVKQTLHELLIALCRIRGTDTRAAIFIHQAEDQKLLFAAAVGMPSGYTSAVDGFPVQECKPSCGSAVFFGQDVYVQDVLVDPRWQPYSDLPQEFNFRACWSFVLNSVDGACLGTLALYHVEPGLPTERDVQQVRYFANVATLLIERHLRLDAQKGELKELQEVARRSQRMGTSLAIVGHELRNPLSAISSALSLLKLGGSEAALRERAGQVIENQVRQMQWLIEDLIDADRLSRGTLGVNPARHRLTTILALSIETISAQFNARHQTFVAELEVPEHVELDCDARRLTQVFNNLLGNAAKYSPEHATVLMRARIIGGEVEIAIQDEGSGIVESDLPEAFKMFRRLNTQEEGLGIGLALVQRLVELHHGRIRVTSGTNGVGSTFTVMLPLPNDEAASRDKAVA